jgi:uncharacterized membrane protein YecN with MAPEG domain
MKFFIVLGGSPIPFGLSYLAFHSYESGASWLFWMVGLVVVVCGAVSSLG